MNETSTSGVDFGDPIDGDRVFMLIRRVADSAVVTCTDLCSSADVDRLQIQISRVPGSSDFVVGVPVRHKNTMQSRPKYDRPRVEVFRVGPGQTDPGHIGTHIVAHADESERFQVKIRACENSYILWTQCEDATAAVTMDQYGYAPGTLAIPYPDLPNTANLNRDMRVFGGVGEGKHLTLFCMWPVDERLICFVESKKVWTMSKSSARSTGPKRKENADADRKDFKTPNAVPVQTVPMR